PPNGSNEPANTAFGSTVASPLSSRPQVAGSLSPRAAASLTRPRATTVFAMSKVIGHFPAPRGIAIDQGLAPRTAVRPPPHAAIAGLEFENASPTISWRAACSVYADAVPKWPAFRTQTHPA